MALATKLPAPEAAKPSLLKRKPNIDADLGLELPEDVSTPSTRLCDYTILLYGSKKIGKTSLFAQFPKALGMLFEPGGKALSMKQVPCPTWAHFKQYLDMIEADDDYCDTIGIDTGRLAYDRCMAYVCQKADIEHPGDEGFGKGWNRVEKEFATQMNRVLLREGKGTLITAHAKTEEVETLIGRKYNKVIPDLSGQAQGFFAGVVDIIAYYHIIGTERWLQIREDDHAVAGCRCEQNFIAKDGFPVHRIPMGNSAKEAYNNLVKAFKNEQAESYAPDNVKAGAPCVAAPVPMKKKIATKR